MATSALVLCCPKLFSSRRTTQTHLSCSSSSPICLLATRRTRTPKPPIQRLLEKKTTMAALVGVGVALNLVGSASAVELPMLDSSLLLNEPPNALSLPTWAIHVSSVVEWITAMILVWQYGKRIGYESWKGLSWGMVPLLGGAFCACTWHFFYNSESLEVLVVLQAALTVIGNATMCLAAFRIYKSSEERSRNL
ncbi:uncharacterized protein LOC131164069 isoform X2 [Malania oleifera]|uniref:uncharacterized protein LOC131164069 isoform X2 n=1 Tax=Malania oleifera TaxID=397392 RepID=UPI0025ADCBEC|nr:uncharacterized protein LOC131164069 isoform X2 [Malania oleifera]XP_057977000.1 uncharacterized protein LOC131164069 isoform X2 [Malania oleifera]